MGEVRDMAVGDVVSSVTNLSSIIFAGMSEYKAGARAWLLWIVSAFDHQDVAQASQPFTKANTQKEDKTHPQSRANTSAIHIRQNTRSWKK